LYCQFEACTEYLTTYGRDLQNIFVLKLKCYMTTESPESRLFTCGLSIAADYRQYCFVRPQLQ